MQKEIRLRAWDGNRIREVFKIIFDNTGFNVFFYSTISGKEPGHLHSSDDRLAIMRHTGLKGFENDIAEVCVFLVSPSNTDNDQHFRGVIDFENGKFVFVIHKYLKFDGSKSGWVNISAKYLPFYDEELDEDGTYTVDYYDFLAMSSNLGEFNDDDVKIVGNVFDNPDLLT